MKVFAGLLICVCVGASVGCGGESTIATAVDASPIVDDVEGRYGTLALGATEAQLAAAFGERQPASEGEPLIPLTADDGFGPPDISPDVSEPAELAAYRYDYSVFEFLNGKLMVATAQGNKATTSRGVSIGDPLEDAEAAYPELPCGEAPVGAEHGEAYPACGGRVESGLYLWFGGDPIENITLSSARIGHPTG